MFRVIILLLSVLYFPAAQGAWTWKCDKKIQGTTLDYRNIQGTWYRYGVLPSELGFCYNYTITRDSQNENLFNVHKTHTKSLFHNKVFEDYDLVSNLDSQDLTLTKNYFWNFKSSTTWQVVATEFSSPNNNFIILYRCSFFREYSEIWTMDPTLTSAEKFPEDIQARIKDIGFAPSDYQLKNDGDCRY